MHCLCWLSRDSSWWHSVVAVILGSAGQWDQRRILLWCEAACKGEILLGPNFLTFLGNHLFLPKKRQWQSYILWLVTSEIWDPGGCDGPWGHKEDNSFQHWRGFRNFWWCLFGLRTSAFSCFTSLRVSTFLVHYARLFVLFSANYFHNWREMLEGEEETSSPPPPLRHV